MELEPIRRKHRGVQGVRTTVFTKGQPTVIKTGSLTLKEARPYYGPEHHDASNSAMLVQESAGDDMMSADAASSTDMHLGTQKNASNRGTDFQEEKPVARHRHSHAASSISASAKTGTSEAMETTGKSGTKVEPVVVPETSGDDASNSKKSSDEDDAEEDGDESDSSEATDVTQELQAFELKLRDEVDSLRNFIYFAKKLRERRPHVETPLESPSVTERIGKRFMKLQEKIYGLKELATTFKEERDKALKDLTAEKALTKKWEARSNVLEARMKRQGK